VDIKATIINILQDILAKEHGTSWKQAYKVVAFMVNVRLVLNKVKRKVGIVMVVKVMSQ